MLLYTLAKSQACVDGNKRVAFILTVEFLALNGADLDEESEMDAAQRILEAAESDRRQRDQTVLKLTLWFERHICEGSDE